MSKALFALVALSMAVIISGTLAESSPLLTGRLAFGCFRSDAPGVRRKITSDDLPSPFATDSASNHSTIVAQPRGAALRVPAGFAVEKFASGLDDPRLV